MEKESLTPEVESEVKQYTVEQLKADIMGQYSSVQVDQSDTDIRDARWHYALLPVWILTYRDKAGKDELYYFAMNRQGRSAESSRWRRKTCETVPGDLCAGCGDSDDRGWFL